MDAMKALDCENRMKSIEVLLASYNGEKYIKEQIDSILNQSVQDFHLTVSDDGSTDSTIEILDDYAQRYPQRITRVDSGRRFGNARDHFFWLIAQCRKDYMFTCDQDDRWYPEKIARSMEAMQKAEQAFGKDMPILVFSDQTPTDDQLRPFAASLMRYQNQRFDVFDYRGLLMQNAVTGGAMVFNRALAELALQCSGLPQTIMHDWWLAVVAARFGKVVYIDEPLSDYRQHGANQVGAKNVRSIGYVGHVLANLAEMRRRVQGKKRQAEVFLQTYGERLTQEDKAFLKGFIKERSGACFYIRHRRLMNGLSRFAGMILLG